MGNLLAIAPVILWLCCPFVFVGTLLDAIENIKNGQTYGGHVFLAGLTLLLFLGPPLVLTLL